MYTNKFYLLVSDEGMFKISSSYSVHDNAKNNGSIDLKLEHTVVYENSSDEFDIGHCLIKVKVTA